MTHTVPGEVDPRGFDANLDACSDALKQIVAYLQTSAQHAGAHVVARRYRHADPNSGWGVTYYTGKAAFCDIHPKAHEEHAWVHLRGVDCRDVEAAGFESSKQYGWFKIRGTREAVRFVTWILRAHDSRTSTTA
jgi:hypothetical protein